MLFQTDDPRILHADAFGFPRRSKSHKATLLELLRKLGKASCALSIAIRIQRASPLQPDDE